MKKKSLIIATLVSAISIAWAAETIWIHQNNKITLGLPISLADNITLSDDGASVNFNQIDGTTHTTAYTEIEKVTLGNAQEVITINYNGTDAEIVNPYAFQAYLSLRLVAMSWLIQLRLRNLHTSLQVQLLRARSRFIPIQSSCLT